MSADEEGRRKAKGEEETSASCKERLTPRVFGYAPTERKEGVGEGTLNDKKILKFVK